MQRIRIQRRGVHRERPSHEALRPDPRDPDVLRAKAARPCRQKDSQAVTFTMLGNWVLGHGFDLSDLEVHRPTLEEVYLSLTGPASKKDQP